MKSEVKRREVCYLPPAEIRQFVDRKVKDFARGKLDRNAMMYSVAAILQRYGLKRLPLGAYSVSFFGYYEDLPIVHIFSRLHISESCPACGSNIWRYIQTERELVGNYDIITAFCLDCGCFYRKFGWKKEDGANAPA